MQAVRCREWGPPDVLRLEKVVPRELAPSDVRIRVRAAGVNFADSLMVGGTYQVKPPFPFTPGLETAGEIVEVGSAVPSALTQTEGTGSRLSLARMASAGLVQTNGLASSLCCVR